MSILAHWEPREISKYNIEHKRTHCVLTGRQEVWKKNSFIF